MRTTKKSGVGMNPSGIHFMEFTTGSVESKFTNQSKEQNQGKSENPVDSKQQPPSEYRKLGEIIKKYEGEFPDLNL